MSTLVRALLVALVVPIAAFAELPQLPDLEAEVKRVTPLSGEERSAALLRHLAVVLERSSGRPELNAGGRQVRIPVAGPGGVAFFEYEYFDKDRTVRVKSLDKDKAALVKVWWPSEGAPFTGFSCRVDGTERETVVVCTLTRSEAGKEVTREMSVQPAALNHPNAAR